MQAVLQDSYGDETTLYVGTCDIMEPSNGEILIKVYATALNRMDLLQCRGTYPVPPDASKIIGVEVSGYIEKIGPNCSGKFCVGDRVMSLLQGGGYAEYAVGYEETTMHAPESLSFHTLASIPEQWITAYQLLFKVGNMNVSDAVLLHAASSGVGLAAIQMAKRFGGKCIATCRSDEKVLACLEMGADVAFNVSNNPNFSELVLQATNGRGVDMILDPVGETYLAENLKCCAMDSRWVIYGLMGGKGVSDESFLGKLMAKRISLLPTTLRSRSRDYKKDLTMKCEEEVIPKIVSGEYKVRIEAVYPLTTDGVQVAHKHMASNANIGKIVLSVRNEN